MSRSPSSLQITNLFSILIIFISINSKVFGENKIITLNASNIISKLSCYQDEEKILEATENKQKLLIEFPQLITTPIINSRVTCKKFLKLLPGALAKQNSELKLHLSKTKQSAYYRMLNTELVQICAELKLCSRDMIDKLFNKSSYSSCQLRRSLSEYFKIWKPRIKQTTYTPVDQVKLEIFPFMPFSEKLLQYQNDGTIFASTMTMGQTTVKKYYQHFQKQPGKLVLMHDAGLIFSTEEHHLLSSYFHGSSKMFALPLTSGRYFDTVHHWKFLYNDQSPLSSLSSMNLNSPDKVNFFDATYTFDNPAVKNDLMFHFNKLSRLQCSHQEDFECLSNLVTRSEYEAKRVQKAFKRSCALLAQNNSKTVQQNYFIEPKTADLNYILKNLIKSAKNEIILITHKFKLDRIYQELLKAKHKGIKVYIYVTSPPPFKTSGDQITYITKSNQLLYNIPDPHLKTMLVDRQTLWFGTGNFSYNAFNKASELYAVTHDQNPINKTLEIAAVLSSGFSSKQKNKFKIKPPSENWLYLDSTTAVEYQKYTTRSDKDWLKNYLKIKPQTVPLLQQCKLDHLLVIHHKLFNECRKTQSLT